MRSLGYLHEKNDGANIMVGKALGKSKSQYYRKTKTDHARSTTFGDGQSGAPLVLQDVQADAAFRRDVGMEHLGGETYFGRLEWICTTKYQVLHQYSAAREKRATNSRWGTGL
jgi:hypothetical protein